MRDGNTSWRKSEQMRKEHKPCETGNTDLQTEKSPLAPSTEGDVLYTPTTFVAGPEGEENYQIGDDPKERKNHRPISLHNTMAKRT